ncbi:MAG: deoxyribose-phosphate aldolase [Candidatus Berkelbacteria bacterium]|nr:deoxyribose-phosphate aldolase [Candidatus Berkelbacteria bacterium]
MEISRTSICKYIDHTNVKADATEEDIKELCQEAIKYKFHSVCVTPYRVKIAAEELGEISRQARDDNNGDRDDNKKPAIICVIGFPFGFTTTQEKINEGKTAIKDGATEIDMVQNIGAVKEGNFEFVQEEIHQIVEAIAPVKLKVIMEIGFLTKEELIESCKRAKSAGAAFVKSSTGYGPRVPTPEDIKIMREAVGSELGVKASGGIHTFDQAKAMIEAGATRLGTSSALRIIGIVEEELKDKAGSKE